MTLLPSDAAAAFERREFRRSVRGTALWAAIGGGLMVYFGRAYTGEAKGSEAYSLAVFTWVWTLRLGGVAMLATAALCLTGHAVALLVDAAACAGIALLLIVTGAVFLANNDFDGLLSLIFAAMFGSAGWRSWQLFSRRPAAGEPAAPAEATPAAPSPDRHSILEAMRRRASSAAAPPPPADAPPPAPARNDSEPTDGFLAALAREEPPKPKP